MLRRLTIFDALIAIAVAIQIGCAVMMWHALGPVGVALAAWLIYGRRFEDAMARRLVR